MIISLALLPKTVLLHQLHPQSRHHHHQHRIRRLLFVRRHHARTVCVCV